MPAQIVIAHDDAEFADKAASVLRAAGYKVVTLSGSMSALEALDQTRSVELLIACVVFREGTPNGVSLALMARRKQPGIKVLFTALPDAQEYTRDIGEFLAMPVSVADVVATVQWMLAKDEARGAG